LDDGLDNLFGSLVQSGIDDFESGVAKRAGDHLGASIVTVEAGFGDYDPIRALHQSSA
jgi:hypothetical protein